MALPTILRARRPNAQPDPGAEGFCLNPDLIRAVLVHAKPLGHHEAPETLNLGFGFLYYALARTLRPKHVVVIGSGFGFSVVCLALGLRDNAKGQLSFVDPSYSVLTDGPFKTVGGTSQWDEPEKVKRHFARFGVDAPAAPTIASAATNSSPATRPRRCRRSIWPSSTAATPTRTSGRTSSRRCGTRTRTPTCCCTTPTSTCASWCGTRGSNAGSRRSSAAKELFEFVDFPFSSGVAIVRVLENDAWRFLDPAKSS